MKTFVQTGEILTVVAPSGGVVSGVPFFIGKLFLVPQKTADATDSVACATRGVFTFAKKAATALLAGAEAYWDATPGEVTDTEGDGKSCGIVVEDAASDDTTVKVAVFGFAFEQVDASTVTTAMLANLAVTAAKLAADAVTVAKIADGALTADATGRAKMADLFLSTGKIAAAAVTKAKALVFFSTEVTCTGASQNVAHGLGAVPAGVLIVPTELASDLAAGHDTAEGSHDATNVVFTGTVNHKVKILAWA